jgi:tetratricopeptide (TPR) repeat protein
MPMRKRLVGLPGALLTLATSGCFLFGDYPTTWDGPYKKAIEELGTAPDDVHRFYALEDAAKASFELGKAEEAQGYAQQALDLATRFRDNWNYGNAIHDGHMVLGRVALRKGDVEAAKRELLEAGKTPGSPQLNSFGPNMSLAKDLLERKEADTVVAYFDLCRKFWEMERGRLRRWSVLAKGGEMPDFEANLVY